MNGHLTTEMCEARVRDELDAEQAAAVDAHAAECVTCRAELDWVRTERALLSRRRTDAMPGRDALWAGIEARIAAAPQPIIAQTSSRAAGTAKAATRRRLFGDGWNQTVQWMAVAAMATLMVGGIGLQRAGFLKFRSDAGQVSLQLGSSAPTVGADAATTPAALPQDLRATAPATGGVTLRLSTGSADIDVVRASDALVHMLVHDAEDVRSVALVREAAGDLRATFDRSDRLSSGHVRVEVPAGSSLDIQTSSGSVHVRDIGGDLRIRSESGDVVVSGVRKLDGESESGSFVVEQSSGPSRVHTESGDVRFAAGETGLGAVDIKTESGEVDVSGRCSSSCAMQIGTSSGDVRLHMLEGSPYALHVRSQSGELKAPRELLAAAKAAAPAKPTPPKRVAKPGATDDADEADEEDNQDEDGPTDKMLHVGQVPGAAAVKPGDKPVAKEGSINVVTDSGDVRLDSHA